MTVSIEEELVSVKKELSKERKRLELIIYPVMVAFIILSAYGFYLINSIARDIHIISYHISSISESSQKNNDIIATSLIEIAAELKEKSIDKVEKGE